MKKKRPVIRFPKAKPTAEIPDRHWHNGGDTEIMLYTRSLQIAAKTLIESLDLGPNPKAASDTGPVILRPIRSRFPKLIRYGGWPRSSAKS
jgi:hypothetical protein